MASERIYSREAFANFMRLSAEEQDKFIERAKKAMELQLQAALKSIEKAIEEELNGKHSRSLSA